MLTGLTRAEKAAVIEDRATAIAWALQQASASDVVLIAGKGHEEYQQVGIEKRPFSDYAVAHATLSASVKGDSR